MAAGAGQDGDPDRRVVVDLLPGVCEPDDHLGAQRVACFRAVHREREDVSVLLNQEMRLLGHNGKK